LWEAHVFGAGGYESAARFLIGGLIDAGVDVEISPYWDSADLREIA
jgi:hypothetical protein